MTVTEELESKIKLMNDEEKLQLVTPCGYCCLSCPVYVKSTCRDEAVIEQIRRRCELTGLTADEMIGRCPGCRPAQGKPHGMGVCPTYECCVNNKGLNFCHECEDFPCLKLAPIAKNAEMRPHNTKIYNLLMLKRLGLDGYITSSWKLWSQFARGRTPVDGGDVQL